MGIDEDIEQNSQESPHESDGENENTDERCYRTFTYNMLFKWILTYCDDDATQQIRFVSEWLLQSSENIIMSLLINR